MGVPKVSSDGFGYIDVYMYVVYTCTLRSICDT